jgi:hypothetical protein
MEDLDHLNKLSRDELRKLTSKYKVGDKLNISHNEIRKLNKLELIKAIKNSINRKKDNGFIKEFEICEDYFKEGTKRKEKIVPKPKQNQKMVQKSNNAFKRITYDHEVNNIKTLFDDKENEMLDDIKDKRNYKISLKVKVLMKRETENIEDIWWVSTKNKILLKGNDRKQFLVAACNELIQNFDCEQRTKSGWTLIRTLGLELNRSHLKVLKGSSYVELPEKIKNKKAIVNVKNNDEKCFMWSILAALYPVKENPNRLNNYTEYENELNFKNVSFPVSLTDIPRFEKLNNLAVNVFCEGKNSTIEPLLISNRTDLPYDKIIDLFFIKDESTNHYCWIKNLEKLLFSQVSKYEHKKYICKRCLSYFNLKNKYLEHINDCKVYDAVKFTPASFDYIEFKNYHKTQNVPYVIYADFESIINKIDICENDKITSFSIKTAKHEASGFYALTLENNEINDEKLYRGKDSGQAFIKYIINKCDELICLFQTKRWNL